MHRCRFVAVLLLLAASTGAARAELKFSTSTVTLGEIRGGQPLTQRFTGVNTGGMEAHVLEVRPGCGCLSPRLSKTRLAPGEQISLEFDLRTLGQSSGPHTWVAHVRYKCGEEITEVPLTISANIINDILLQPSSLSLIARGAMTQEVMLTDTRSRPLHVKSVHSSSPYLKARVVKQEKNAVGNWQTRIALDLAADCPPGRHTETLAIHTTDPEYAQLVVPVAVMMNQSAVVSAHPDNVELDLSGGASRFVRITSSLSAPVVIECVTAGHPAITCTWVRGPENAATVRLRVNPSLVSEALESKVEIRVSSPHKHTLHVPVRIRID